MKDNQRNTTQEWRLTVQIALLVAVSEAATLLLLAAAEIDGLAGVLLHLAVLVLISALLIDRLVIKPQLQQHQQHLLEANYLARHDELTGLCNRRMFYDHLEHCLSALRRQQRCGALIYVDLDSFKPVNDEYGHTMGDRVLAELGQRLAQAVRGEDVAARLGGDEFALLVTDLVDSESARQRASELAQRVEASLSAPLTLQGKLIQVGCSIGVHLLEPGCDDVRVALKAADRAMYRAKQQRGSIVFSDALCRGRYELLKIGVADIDHEHAEIDQLLSELIRGKGGYLSGLEGFISLVEMHFANEEAVSRRLGLNMTEAHRRAHDVVLEALREVALQRHHEDWVDQLVRIGTLLEQHIKIHDRVLSEAVPGTSLQPAAGV